MLTTVKAQACQGTQKDRPGPGVEPQAWGKRARTPEPVEKEVSEDITSLPDYECLSQQKRCKRDHPQSAQAPNLALVDQTCETSLQNRNLRDTKRHAF